MWKSFRWELGVLAGSLLLMAGCVTVTPVSGEFPNVTPTAAQSGTMVGRKVRWGGVLVSTQPETSQTCFTVMGLPLQEDGRPYGRAGEANIGRFIACSPGFYDPVSYSAGREITFIGTITGVRHATVGTYVYPYPVLKATTVYSWPSTQPSFARERARLLRER